ncbi:PocR ligand-binding domain-containing protein [Acetobacterium sp. K1/6]|uniref:sensor histidine kinase n=1 Tax=Acetobacterium sp. K1/6 TaxID=3055467 RepID=UPI002ACAC12D|nr:PocR ligand-binding domain-containing protein [Acetobacterium sp. K1/6]MDZ5724790.1 PocR ligand-binding domain-containing protein [Acetobacterium sp. K1/6]
MRVLLKITDIIDVEVLQRIQDSFSDATGLAAVTVDYKGNPITEYSNFSEYCTCVRKESSNRDCCFQSDAHGGIESARSGKPSIYICHGGLVDLAVPIMVKGNYLGAIMAGQVKIDEEEMKRLSFGTSHELTDFSKNPEIMDLYDKTLKTTLTQVRSAADLLYTIANYLVEKQMIHIIQEELHNKNLELMEEVKLRSEVEASLKEADLKALQAQINPHFLFNVLNTIGRLALLEGADKTQEMIYAFSDMMRYTLKKEKNNVVTLKEEMEHVQNYLSIQKMRLGNRLNYLVEVDEMAEDILCPFMTIQPFVENAIIHAIEPNARGGEVRITADILKEIAILKIVDDGKGIPDDRIHKILDGTYEADGREKNTGIGINNANKRLMYYYGVDYGVEIKSELEKGTEITIKIPRKSLAGRGL